MTTVTNETNEYKKDTEDHFVFTRYLYEKEEVEIALLLNILHKKEEESLFWAYELHYSGFTDKLIQLLWKIYYELFSTLNASFENYLLNKLNAPLFTDEPKTIASVINNFLIRPFNMDVFILTKLEKPIIPPVKQSTNSLATLKKRFASFLENHDYNNIGLNILHLFTNEQLSEIFAVSIKYFSKFIANLNSKKIIDKIDAVVKKNKYDKRILILIKILHYYSILSNLKFGKNIYVFCEENDITNYQTITADLNCHTDNPYNRILPAYKILKKANLYCIDNLKCLRLFGLKRDNYDVVSAYLNYWLYYASFSPIWEVNIQKYNGTINHATKTITFDTDENEELFYNNYNYEPDEQPKEIQDKSLVIIEDANLETILFDKNNNNCLIENTSILI
jgi:hypothetical protein